MVLPPVTTFILSSVRLSPRVATSLPLTTAHPRRIPALPRVTATAFSIHAFKRSRCNSRHLPRSLPSNSYSSYSPVSFHLNPARSRSRAVHRRIPSRLLCVASGPTQRLVRRPLRVPTRDYKPFIHLRLSRVSLISANRLPQIAARNLTPIHLAQIAYALTLFAVVNNGVNSSPVCRRRYKRPSRTA